MHRCAQLCGNIRFDLCLCVLFVYDTDMVVDIKLSVIFPVRPCPETAVNALFEAVMAYEMFVENGDHILYVCVCVCVRICVCVFLVCECVCIRCGMFSVTER